MGVLDVFDQVTDALSGSPWTYPLITGIVAGDAVLPVLPGETAVVTGGVLSSNTDLSIVLVMVAGLVGAFVGDTVVYLIGRWAGPWARRVLLSGKRAEKTMHWAEEQLGKRGGSIIVVARFVPGGRTATTFVAGTTGYDFRRFVVADLIGATVWSVYNALIGRIGGAAFENQTWKALLLAFALALVGAGVIEGVRRLLERRNKPEDAESRTPR
ncbi:DedA family protein [uncultured Jatrophihabitans sp.]|uniref:DedA family protein n=1 Tax=uncultured Jatrophihabitans sp. TaxID=1610747 RepID=UPI0035CAA951